MLYLPEKGKGIEKGGAKGYIGKGDTPLTMLLEFLVTPQILLVSD